MAVAKFLDLLMLNLFFCLALLLAESYAERDQKQQWDYMNGKKLDNILDDDRSDLKRPTFSPDTSDHYNLEFKHAIKEIIFMMFAVLSFYINICCCICMLCRCYSQRKRTTLNTTFPAIEKHDSPRSCQSLSTITQSEKSHIVGELINVVTESGVSTGNQPLRYDNESRDPPRSHQSPSLSTIAQSDRLHIVEFSNPLHESSTETKDQPPGYEDIIRTELNGKEKCFQ